MTILLRFSLPIFILIIITSVVSAQAQKTSPALQSLVEAERSFAKTSVIKGQREAFIEYFAADGINFTPHPTNTKEALSKRPPTPTPQPFILNWQPVFGDISAAGDLGFTTGPYTLIDNSPMKHPTGNGMYFSIWKKRADKTWQVVVDFGVSTPQAVAPLTTAFTPAIHPTTAKTKVDADSLLLLEGQYSQARKQFGWQQTFEKYFSSDARYYLPNTMPLIGKDAIRTYTGNDQTKIDYVPMKADIAASGDLGYVYGSFDGRLEKGYYLHVWRRNNSGQYEIVTEIYNFLPQEKKVSLQPRPEDVSSIDGIIKAFYEVISGPAGQPRQWERDSTLYVPGVRFIALSSKDGKVKATVMEHEKYIKASNDVMVKEGFFEQELHRTTHQFGNIAQVFSTYQEKLKPDGAVIGRGINSLELYFDGTRWWISAVTWQDESAANPIPKDYLAH